MRQSFPAQSLRSIDVTPWLAIGNAIFTGRLSEDSLSKVQTESGQHEQFSKSSFTQHASVSPGEPQDLISSEQAT